MAWCAVGQGPGSISRHSAVLFDNNRVCLFGGTDGHTPKSDVFVLEEDTHPMRWMKPVVHGDLPEPRSCHTATKINESTMLVFGGSGNRKVFNDVHLLDLEEFNWVETKTLGDGPSPRYGHSASSINGMVYIYGGTDGKRMYDDMFVYDSERTAWFLAETYGPNPGRICGHSAVAAGSEIFVFGGENEDGRCTNTIHAFNVETFEWRVVDVSGNLPPPRSYHTATMIEDRMFVVAGCNGPRRLHDMHVLNMSTMSWKHPSAKGGPPPERAYHSTVSVRTRLIVIGGSGGFGKGSLNDLFLLYTESGFHWRGEESLLKSEEELKHIQVAKKNLEEEKNALEISLHDQQEAQNSLASGLADLEKKLEVEQQMRWEMQKTNIRLEDSIRLEAEKRKQLEVTLGRKEGEIEDLNKKVSSLSSQVDSGLHAMREMESQLSRMEYEKKSLQSEVESERNTRFSVEGVLSKLQDNLNIETSSRQSAEIDRAVSHDTISKLREDVKSLTEKLSSEQQARAEAENNVVRLEEEMKSLKRTNEYLEVERNQRIDSDKQVRTLMKQLDEITKQRHQLEATGINTNMALQEEKKKLQQCAKEIEAWDESDRVKSSEIADLRENLNAYKEAFSKLSQQNNDLQDRLTEERAMLKDKDESLREAFGELKQLREIRVTLDTQRKELITECETAKARLVIAEKERDKYSKDLANEREQRANTSALLKGVRSDLEIVDKANKKKELELEDLKGKWAEAEKTIPALKFSLDEISAEKARLESSLQQEMQKNEKGEKQISEFIKNLDKEQNIRSRLEGALQAEYRARSELQNKLTDIENTAGDPRLTAFLKNHGLGHYSHLFLKHEIDYDTLPTLSENDLVALGFSSVGPRRKLMSGIQAIAQSARASVPVKSAAVPGTSILQREANNAYTNATLSGLDQDHGNIPVGEYQGPIAHRSINPPSPIRY